MTPRWLCLAFLAAALPAQVSTGTVTRIIDGDTLVVRSGKQTLSLRLFGVDAPENGQPYADESRQHLKDLALGRMVFITKKGTDRFGRTLALIGLDDGVDVGTELVRHGSAWWFRQYDPNNQKLRLLEEQAREEKSGLWADRRQVAPWVWRKDPEASAKKGAAKKK